MANYNSMRSIITCRVAAARSCTVGHLCSKDAQHRTQISVKTSAESEDVLYLHPSVVVVCHCGDLRLLQHYFRNPH